jgi:hypothetical protein
MSTPGIKTAPSLAGLSASKPAPSTPKKGILKSPAASPKPAPRAAANKPLSKNATDYALKAMTTRKDTDDPKQCLRVWGQIQGYQMNFRDRELQYNPNIGPNSALADLQGELESIQNQMSNEKSIEAIKHIYCAIIGLFSQTTLVFNPLDLKIQSLPQVTKQKVFNDGFLNQELTELSILYPELCRPGPLLSVFLQTLTLIRDVSSQEAMQLDPSKTVSSRATNKYSDL